ncbi:hypothetical protein ADL01_34235 [Streptomyces sp. NRRL WC-3618]|nr:hypothetical protein ADL01_34235 [Streptomyces sp. NRRL WC-3618]
MTTGVESPRVQHCGRCTTLLLTLTDWLLRGLIYPIEHHLFSGMPRPHLWLAQPTGRAYCREMGIAYTEMGLVDSYRQALRHMCEMGEPLRGE